MEAAKEPGTPPSEKAKPVRKSKPRGDSASVPGDKPVVPSPEPKPEQHAGTTTARKDKPRAQTGTLPTAWEALAMSVHKVQQLGWAYAVVGIAAVAAIIRGFGVAPGDLTVVAVPIIFVMLLFFIFSKIAKGPLGVLLSWVVMLLLAACAVGLVTSVFFDLPKPIAVLADDVRKAFRIGGAQSSAESARKPAESLVSYTVRGDVPLSSLPERFTTARGNPEDARRKAGDFVVDSGSIFISGSQSGAPTMLIADKLTLKNGARILTNGAYFNVFSTSISSDNGSIVAFMGSEPRSVPAAGGTVVEGRSSRQVVLNVLDRIEGRLRVDLGGEPGGTGAPGKNGSPGTPGAHGRNASSALYECKHGAGDGSAGGNGDDGAQGGAGGNGGNGGNLVLVAKLPAADSVEFFANGGAGGPGGAGGKGGAGGAGGRGGSDDPPLCRGNGRNGANGNAGQDGGAGQPGAAGASGAFERLMPNAKK